MNSTTETTALLEGDEEMVKEAAALLKAAGIDHMIRIANGDVPGS